MEFTSLKSIIYDLLNIIRAGQPTDDEPISERQIENWIHQYRAKFLKQALDKGDSVSPDFIQTIEVTDLVLDPKRKVYHSNIKLPPTINLRHKSGVVSINDLQGHPIQLIAESRVHWQGYNRWSSDETLAYLKDGFVYLHNSKGLQHFEVRGYFANPVDAYLINNSNYDYTSPYPVPLSLLPTIKQEILKNELGIETSVPTDETNNSNHDL